MQLTLKYGRICAQCKKMVAERTDVHQFNATSIKFQRDSPKDPDENAEFIA